jgi:hypothetical protein
MPVWMAVIAWGLVQLTCALINWQGRIRFERARAAAVAEVVRVLPPGGLLQEQRADGTALHVQVPCPSRETRSPQRKHPAIAASDAEP